MARREQKPAEPAGPVDQTDPDAENQLFDDDFEGSWERLEYFEVPPIDQISPAGLDIISRRLGINITDPDTDYKRKAAAVEWFHRNASGQRVTFRQVFRGGSVMEQFFGKARTLAEAEAEAEAEGEAAGSDEDGERLDPTGPHGASS